MTLEQAQSYIRIALYTLFGFLGNYAITVPDSTKTLIVTIVGFLVTFAWTLWGNRLSAILADAKARAGVDEVVVKVDANKVDPGALADATPSGVTVKPS